MIKLSADDLLSLSGVSFANISAEEAAGVNKINTDTRTLRKGEVFWALPGERFDGHDFVAAAIEKGARYCVVQKDRLAKLNAAEWPLLILPDTLKGLQELAAVVRQKFNGTVVALTGSNGKTTTKEMIAHILSRKMKVHKTFGNLNNHIGCPLTLLQLEDEHQAAVIELGSNHPGEIAALAAITRPDQALVTNIGEAHLEFFRDRQTVAKEKLSLFEAVAPDGVLYVNQDDPYLAGYDPVGRRTVTYGIDRPARMQAQVQGVNSDGCASFVLNGRTEIQLALPGLHQVQNALAACAVALEFGFNESEIKQALESYTAPEKRMQMVRAAGVTFLNDAYNANPVSMRAAFETVSRMERSGRLFLVLGDMLELGADGPKWHRQALEQALALQPEKIFVMGQAMSRAAGWLGDARIEAFDHHQALYHALSAMARPGDLILLKGSRGIQLEKVLVFFTETPQTQGAEQATN